MLNSISINSSYSAKSVSKELEASDQIRRQQKKDLDRLVSFDEAESRGSSFLRPGLSAPKEDVNYLEELAKAFSQIYSTMSKTTVSQSNDLTNIQNVDMSMARAVNDVLTVTINKEEQNYQAYQALENKLTSDQSAESTANTVGIVLGVIFIVLTAASSLLDFGASLGAAAAEAAGLAGEEGGAALGEEGAVEMEEMSGDDESVNDDDNSVDESSTNNNTDETNAEQSQQTENSENNQEVQEKNNLKDSEENSKSSSNFQKLRDALKNKWFKRVVGVGANVAFTLPNILSGIFRMQEAGYNMQLATLQGSLGKEMGLMKETNGFLQYYQQMSQRQTGLEASQFIPELEDVIDTASQIFSTYRQIPVNLSRAV